MKAPVLAFFCILLSVEIQAAPISWNTPTTIAGDSDVSTTGTLDRAFNLGRGDTSTGPFGSTTVNGVTFDSFSTYVNDNGSASVSFGNTTVSAIGGTNQVRAYNASGSNTAPFSNLSASYRLLLSTNFYNDNGDLTLTLGGLVNGQGYQLQIFVSEARTTPRTETITAGDTVSIAYNTTGVAGGVGQHVEGTFTADATGSQSITFHPTSTFPASQINGFQLRVVPEPSAAVLSCFGVLAFAASRRSRPSRG